MQDNNTDNVPVISEYLGQDFLTWLWFFCETNNWQFKDKNGQDHLVSLEQKITVQGGEGESKDTTVSSGQLSEFREAKTGISTGKKVQQAKLKIEQDSNVWEMQIKAPNFDITGLKTPKVEMKLEEGEDPDSRFLEKMFLIEKALQVLHELFEYFIRKRFGPDWNQELHGMRKWLQIQG